MTGQLIQCKAVKFSLQINVYVCIQIVLFLFEAIPRLIACETGISCCVMGSTTTLMVQVFVSWMNFGPVGTSEGLTAVDSANIKPEVSKLKS